MNPFRKIKDSSGDFSPKARQLLEALLNSKSEEEARKVERTMYPALQSEEINDEEYDELKRQFRIRLAIFREGQPKQKKSRYLNKPSEPQPEIAKIEPTKDSQHDFPVAITLSYYGLEITVPGESYPDSYSAGSGIWEPGWTEENEIEVDYEYEVDGETVADFLSDLVLQDEEKSKIIDEEYGGDDYRYIEDHFDDLVEEYDEELRDHFEEDAKEEAEEKYADSDW